MFIAPNPPSLQFAARKKQPAPAPAQQPKVESKQEKVKPLGISKAVEKQLQKLATDFNQPLDEMKKSYQLYTTMIDENGLRMFSESNILAELRQLLTPRSMVSESLDETGGHMWMMTESLNETGRR